MGYLNGTFDGCVEASEEVDRKIATIIEASKSFDKLSTRHSFHALVFTM